jgi:hypothetical protein
MVLLLHIFLAFVGGIAQLCAPFTKKSSARGAECPGRHGRMDAAALCTARQTITFKEECHVIGYQQQYPGP